MTGALGRGSLVILALLCGTVASAEPLPPTVWLAPVEAGGAPGAGMLAPKLREGVRGELRKTPTLQLVGADEPRLTVKAGEADPRLEDAANLRTAGKAALEAGDLDAAEPALEGALERYALGIASLQRTHPVAETLLLLAVIDGQRGRTRAAAGRLHEALLLDPERADEDVPEALRGALKRARRAAARGRARLTVRSEPPGAEVRVGGRAVGTAPITLKRLAPGAYWVQAAGEGGLDGARVEVGRSVTLTLRPRAELGLPAAEAPDAATLAALRALDGDVTAPADRAPIDAAAATTHARFAVLPWIQGEAGALQVRGVVVDLQRHRVRRLPPIAVTANLSSVFVKAVEVGRAARNAAEALAPLEPVPAEKRRRRGRRRGRSR